MKQIVAEKNKVSPFFFLILVHSTQTGIGVLTFQSEIMKGAGQDAWVSVLIVGLSLHLFFMMMLAMLKRSSEGDVVSLHRDLFGKTISVILNFLLLVYFFLSALIIINSYIEILQIWVFDGIAMWEFSFLICLAIFYIVSGGFRIITGIAFFSVLLPTILLFSIIYIVTTLDITYIMPFFNHSFKEYVYSAWKCTFMFIGFESVLLFFPFIKEGGKNAKWGHLGLLVTTILYLVTTIVTFTFFTQEKLNHLVWPTLTMIKMLSFPFLERFELLFIFTWFLIIIPAICINVWAVCRIAKRTIPKINANYVLLTVLILFFIFNSFFVDAIYTLELSKIVTYGGITVIAIYTPIMFLLSLLKGKKQ